MPKKSKPFIDKKAPGTYNFRLVHRSQRDPLIADEESSKRVLLQVDAPNTKVANRIDDSAASAVGREEATGSPKNNMLVVYVFMYVRLRHVLNHHFSYFLSLAQFLAPSCLR